MEENSACHFPVIGTKRYLVRRMVGLPKSVWIRRSWTAASKKATVNYILGFTYIAPAGYDNIVLTEVIAEILELRDISKNRSTGGHTGGPGPWD